MIWTKFSVDTSTEVVDLLSDFLSEQGIEGIQIEDNVPLTEDIDTYFAREVLPYAPDAWIDQTKTKVGYEIPMTRYFYEYQAPEPVEDIMARITQLEQDISASLAALFHKEA